MRKICIAFLKSFSFFEVDSNYTNKILSSFAGANYEGRPIAVEVAQAPEGKSARGTKNDFIKGDSFQRPPAREFGGDRQGGFSREKRVYDRDRSPKSFGSAGGSRERRPDSGGGSRERRPDSGGGNRRRY